MPKYLVTYHGAGAPATPEEAQEAMQAFGAWLASAGTAVIDPGAPLSAARTISQSGAAEGQTEGPIGGYTILEADDLDAAVKLVENHPFISRGGKLQVSETVNLGG